jgi:hypothetical protein
MQILGAILGLMLLLGFAVLLRDVFQKLSGSGVVLLAGLVLLFVGERFVGDGDLRPVVSGVAVLVLLGAVGLRAYAMLGSEGARRKGHRGALVATSVAVGSLVLYAFTLPSATAAFGLEDDAIDRWNGVWWSLFPILTLAGVLPTLLIDRVLALHPRVMPAGAMAHAVQSGLALALGGALLFPLNYLAASHDIERDVAYFKTTRPGEASIAIVTTASEPIEAILFFSPGSDVGREVEPYFRDLAAAAPGNFSYRISDQALEPKLAEELKVRDNGQIVLRQGDNDQKFKIDTDIDRAKRELRKLDGTVQKNLLKLTKGQRNLYFLTGHGEASSREKDDKLRKLNLYKREVLEAQGFRVKSYGQADGSTQQMPDDAGAVIVAAPTEPLLPEEVEAMLSWFDEGGHLLITLEPGSAPHVADLLAGLGVEAGEAPLAHTSKHLKQTGGPADRVLLATNKFGTHASVRTLQRNSLQMGLIVPTAVWVRQAKGTSNTVKALIRSLDGTFEDLDGDREQDADTEPSKVFEMAVAVEGPKTKNDDGTERQGRAIVVGDTSLLADEVLRYSKGNVVFGSDAMKWLVGDEDIAGEVNNEEDVKIQHTRDEDTVWFLLSIVGVPGVVLALGFVIVRLRRREGAA